MNKTPRIYIDQAIDPYARAFQPTANVYDEYLQSLYQGNAHSRAAEWHENDKQKEAIFLETIWRIAERRNMRRSNIHLALVGPGLQPMGSDITDLSAKLCVKHLERLTVVDFSTFVVSQAMEDIRSKVKGIDSKLAGMQFDFTHGFSTAHTRVLKEAFETLSTFEEMSAAAEKLAQLSLEDVKEMLHQKWADASSELLKTKRIITDLPVDWIGGGINEDRTLALTANGQQLTTDLWYLPMVVAGTGAAAESKYIWTKYEDATEDTEDENFEEKNKKFLSNIHTYIANYNTLAAFTSIKRILLGNPKASVLVVTDVSTIMNSGDETYPRLKLETLEAMLADVGIKLEIRGSEWEWNDEPHHRHGVRSFICRVEDQQKLFDSEKLALAA